MKKPTAKVIHYTEVPLQEVGSHAPGAGIRWVIDEEHDGAPVYALRVVELTPGGQTPDHIHPYEHENFVIEGRGKVQIEDKSYPLQPGDVVFVPAGIRHHYENAADVPFKFLCGIPVSHLISKQ